MQKWNQHVKNPRFWNFWTCATSWIWVTRNFLYLDEHRLTVTSEKSEFRQPHYWSEHRNRLYVDYSLHPFKWKSWQSLFLLCCHRVCVPILCKSAFTQKQMIKVAFTAEKAAFTQSQLYRNRPYNCPPRIIALGNYLGWAIIWGENDWKILGGQLFGQKFSEKFGTMIKNSKSLIF